MAFRQKYDAKSSSDRDQLVTEVRDGWSSRFEKQTIKALNKIFCDSNLLTQVTSFMDAVSVLFEDQALVAFDDWDRVKDADSAMRITILQVNVKKMFQQY